MKGTKIHSIISECPITNDRTQIKYFDLGNIPLVNNLCNTREDSLNVDRFPLSINYYEKSGLSSLDFSVDSRLLFSHYLFKSEVNIPYYKHCQDMFIFAQNYVKVSDGFSIADIGGNDGTLLDAFRSTSVCNLHLLNIDPSENLAKLSVDRHIPVYTDFFSYDLAKKLDKKFDLVISTNVFQHLREINSFAKGVEYMLNDGGVWILEFPYWIHDMQTNQFDQIYHEHVYYYSVTPLVKLMNNNGLRVINVSKQVIHGGTLRLVMCKSSSKFEIDNSVNEYLEMEKDYQLEYHVEWGDKVHNHIRESREFIKKIKSEGKTIYGFGAAAKGCIYLNSMGVTHKEIDYIIDDTDIKQGKFIPGTGIQVVSRDILNTKKPDYILILAHNFADYIIKSLEFDGKYIILIPQIQIKD